MFIVTKTLWTVEKALSDNRRKKKHEFCLIDKYFCSAINKVEKA